MAVAAAEQQTSHQADPRSMQVAELEVLFALPAAEGPARLAVAASETTFEMLAEESATQLIGRVAVGSFFEPERKPESQFKSLREAIHAAANGDPLADKLVETSCATEASEIAIKVGHVGNPVPIEVDRSRKLIQYGQPYEDIQANSLRRMQRDPLMRPRTEAEARNGYRIEYGIQESLFDDYCFLAVSLAENSRAHGFSVDTMSCSLQLTTKNGEGFTIEPAFVAGVAEPDAPPHDIAVATKFYEGLGIDIRDKSRAEILDTPVWIHKSLVPNGVIDVVEMWDQYTAEVVGQEAFFGQAKAKEDYLEYRKKCRVREEGFRPVVMKIKTELITEAPDISTDEMATKRLHKIAEKHMVQHAVKDRSIDARVFGLVASRHLESARMYLEMGKEQEARSEILHAKETAQSYSCPTDVTEGSKTEKDEHGSLKFKCQNGHINFRSHGKLIDRCQICRISVKC